MVAGADSCGDRSELSGVDGLETAADPLTARRESKNAERATAFRCKKS